MLPKMEKENEMAKMMPKNDEMKKMSLFHPCSRRLHLLLMVLIGFFSIVSMRVNMGIAMTCMINSTAVTLVELSQKNEFSNFSINNSDFLSISTKIPELNNLESIKEIVGKCSTGNDGAETVVNDYGGTIIWNPSIQGWIFSSVFYGSLISILPAGYLADTQSPKTLATIAVITYVVGTTLTPYLAMNYGWIPLFIIRIIMGIGDGLTIPSINKLIIYWIPNEEKSTAATIYTSGFSLAGIVGIPLYAYLCSTTFGWQTIFYLCAIIGGIFVIFWQIFGAENPYDCKNMSKRERNYLLSLPELKKQSKTQKLQIPFKKIFKCLPYWSLLLCAFSCNIVITFSQIYLPTFYKEILFLSPVYNGIFGAIPPITEVFFKFGWSIWMDNLKQRKIISATTAIKISQLLCGIFLTILFVVLPYIANCESPFLTLFIFCGVSISLSMTASGFFTSMLSIAPAYTGLISSSTMLTGIIARVATPILVSFFNRTGTLEEWRPIFLIIAGTTIISTVFFTIFGSGELQEWAKFPYGLSEIDFEDIQKQEKLKTDPIYASAISLTGC